jgi:4-diphosphocytidyl-2-C-methyl-D-erythritol kinase
VTRERKAFAKINLDLRIVSVLPEGYHELATVFQTIALHDTIRLVQVAGDLPLTCACDAPNVPPGEQNIVWHAATRLWRALGHDGSPTGLRLEVAKAIPSQAGLAGGSADAAVALGLVAEQWGVPLDDRRCREVAQSLGADVPFFLVGGTARGVGRGDVLEPWPDLPPLAVVLAVPSFGVSTAEAYRWYDASGASASGAGAPDAGASWRAWLVGCRNDLEAPVVARHPSILAVKEQLQAAGAIHALMSGSGSSVFGLFETTARAEAGVSAVRALGAAALRSRTLGRDEYVREALRSTAPRLPPD